MHNININRNIKNINNMPDRYNIMLNKQKTSIGTCKIKLHNVNPGVFKYIFMLPSIKIQLSKIDVHALTNQSIVHTIIYR